MNDTTTATQNLSGDSVTQPVLFIPHGAGPCFFMDWQPSDTFDGMAVFLKNIASHLPERPKAILIISAHWQASAFSVTSGVKPELIYDYYGFPDHTYELAYPAAGAPILAEQVSTMLSKAGLSSEQDASRGFDHGMFIPLKLMFPDADIPVVQLSLRSDLDSESHLAAGKALASLREEGVLIIGSGMSFHNMRGFGDTNFTVPSQAFDEWLTKTIEATPEQRFTGLRDWAHAPYALQCHPSGGEEHLIPLMVVAGAAGADRGSKIYSQQVLKTQLSAFRFG
ncbi:DODA-type extradiol aromatic ring-opening family dioxygenase [Neptunomonas antarctica]|uniref:Aromatic ring-opening dioxygenase, catalytic subunit, LigB family n=1 Tax=Neptunomonas antarctica TaxID=619304 RepID=A0A1N7ITE9_9GAMM|nr:class III extradiol ring-cleavage dioxygenase [Neptunomonas antarctica]SIS40362.1 Aromatic ring-opening dioxygenase, catalytic subunit, LigB family [Neptunomonas antarctica]